MPPANNSKLKAVRRLMTEYKQLLENPPDGIAAGPVSEDNVLVWDCLISGPDETCYEGGVFPATLTFPVDYPLSPPQMKFTIKMLHPNIYPDGTVCISILHAPGNDPMQYETAAERWSPVQSVEKILLSVCSMLAEPNVESPADIDAARLWRDNPTEFKTQVQEMIMRSLDV